MRTQRAGRDLLLACTPFLLWSLPVAAAGPPGTKVPQWTRFEATLESARKYERPFQDASVEVVFTAPSGKTHHTAAFWYDRTTWKVRFQPDEVGVWTWRTRASHTDDTGLHDRSGTFTCVAYAGRNPLYRHGALRLSLDRRHFVHADGTPFFFLGDTAWNGPLKAHDRSWRTYLRDRAGKGFNVIQFVSTQWRSATGNADARPAYHGREKIDLDPEFWKWMDERVDAINEQGLVAAPVVIWAIAGWTSHLNPGQALPDDQIVKLARYIVARWGAHHVTWFLAGDGKYLDAEAERWRRIGRAVFEKMPAHPTTMHPGGQAWVYEEYRKEPWFTYNGYQSGHYDQPEKLRWLTEGPPATGWRGEPAHPQINLEPNYEDHHTPGQKRFDAFSVRRASYWSLLVHPPAGVSYGAHGIWSWEPAPRIPMTHPNSGTARAWQDAMKLPGATHMKHLAALFRSVRWWELRPDPGLLVEQPGKQDAGHFVAAARSEDGRTALIYVPAGGKVVVNLDKLSGPVQATWFDPLTGRRRAGGRLPGAGAQTLEAGAPGQDWVLLLQASGSPRASR